MSNEIMRYSEETFESIKHLDESGEEYWLARELQSVLEYTQWRRFVDAIDRAKLACQNSGYIIEDHFADVGKMVPLGSHAYRRIDDYRLSRYACYLIVMNGDPRKEVIAVGQTYFAVKTRQQELIDHYDELSEDQKRLAIRKEMIAHNKSLAEAAQMAGVEDGRDFAIFQNKGYQGLYGGLGVKEIHERKGPEEERENPRSHGQHRVGCQPVPRYADRRKAAPREHSGQGKGQSNPLRGRQEGQADHRRVRRHHAGRPADAGKEYQAD